MKDEQKIKEIREHIEVIRRICNYVEDVILHHCPFPDCEFCNYIFKDANPSYNFGETTLCPCHVYSIKFVKETVKKLLGEV